LDNVEILIRTVRNILMKSLHCILDHLKIYWVVIM